MPWVIHYTPSSSRWALLSWLPVSCSTSCGLLCQWIHWCHSFQVTSDCTAHTLLLCWMFVLTAWYVHYEDLKNQSDNFLIFFRPLVWGLQSKQSDLPQTIWYSTTTFLFKSCLKTPQLYTPLLLPDSCLVWKHLYGILHYYFLIHVLSENTSMGYSTTTSWFMSCLKTPVWDTPQLLPDSCLVWKHLYGILHICFLIQVLSENTSMGYATSISWIKSCLKTQLWDIPHVSWFKSCLKTQDETEIIVYCFAWSSKLLLPVALWAVSDFKPKGYWVIVWFVWVLCILTAFKYVWCNDCCSWMRLNVA